MHANTVHIYFNRVKPDTWNNCLQKFFLMEVYLFTGLRTVMQFSADVDIYIGKK